MFRSTAYSSAAIARLALSEHARVLADSAALLVPTASSDCDFNGNLVEDAAILAEKAQRLLTLAVIFERIQDVSWRRIGLALSNASRRTVSRQAAHERYANAEHDFHDRFLRAWLLPERASEILATADHFAESISRLNAWMSTRQETGEKPIGAGLTSMSMTERFALIARAESLLQTMTATDVSVQELRRDLEIGLCRRKIELYEDLAVQTPHDPDVLQALADVRIRLTELRTNNS